MAIAGVLGNASISPQGPSGVAGGSELAHLYLEEVDSSWRPVPGGAWGKLTYRTSGPAFSFVFNAHRLEPGMAYALIYYPDPWPGRGSQCLARGVAGPTGDIHLGGTRDTGDLPFTIDWNANPTTTTYPGPPPVTGAKIWLVVAADVSCGVGMTAWHPADYLFERQLVNYVKTP
jgi:hypothetical protein